MGCGAGTGQACQGRREMMWLMVAIGIAQVAAMAAVAHYLMRARDAIRCALAALTDADDFRRRLDDLT